MTIPPPNTARPIAPRPILGSQASTTEIVTYLDGICQTLSELAPQVDQSGKWPERSMQLCGDSGVFRWFLPQSYGGWEWTDFQILLGYLSLSQSCLTTSFILTQWHAAARRILSSPNSQLLEQVGPKLADGSCFVTVGISQLSTSRQHTEPALRSYPTADGYRLEGFAPWVTAAAHADLLILGATLEDGQQILAAVPTSTKGVVCKPGMPLVALSASCTDRVELQGVELTEDQILAGPVENVLLASASKGGGVGGLHTSILAIGHAMRAAAYLRVESQQRSSLRPVADKLSADVEVLRMKIERLTMGHEVITVSELRRRANSLVLRVTQAALQAAKGAGYVEGHPTGRWAREALFFLVWSCPQAVVEANLCDLAGIESPH